LVSVYFDQKTVEISGKCGDSGSETSLRIVDSTPNQKLKNAKRDKA
jgi:hypothetical protein